MYNFIACVQLQFTIKFRGVAQFGRASGSGPEGRVFESPHSDHENRWNKRVSAVFSFFQKCPKMPLTTILPTQRIFTFFKNKQKTVFSSLFYSPILNFSSLIMRWNFLHIIDNIFNRPDSLSHILFIY